MFKFSFKYLIYYITTLPYFGLIHCKVIAPDQMIHAVLPFRTFSKDSQDYVLKFPLCGTCAITENSDCNCTDDERSITGSWTTEEVKLALEKGYRLLKIHEVCLLSFSKSLGLVTFLDGHRCLFW